jgi:energy-coupling factor transport system substrate-specific component
MSTAAARPIHFRWKTAAMLAVTTLVGLGAFLWPLTTDASGDENLAHSSDAPWLFVVALPLLLGILFAALSERGLDAKAIAVLGVLVAAGAILRAPATGVTGFTGILVACSDARSGSCRARRRCSSPRC